jgi:hypothetical protein
MHHVPATCGIDGRFPTDHNTAGIGLHQVGLVGCAGSLARTGLSVSPQKQGIFAILAGFNGQKLRETVVISVA